MPCNIPVKETVELVDKLLPVSASIITGLIAYMYTYKTDKRKEEAELKKLELEQHYKITEESYQKLFMKKIEVYTNLHKIILKHKLDLTTIGMEDLNINEHQECITSVITESSININLLNKLFSYTKEEMFYISRDLEPLISELYISFEHSENLFEYCFRENLLDTPDPNYENDRKNKEFYNTYKKKIDKVISQIETEIKKIKEKIEFN